MKHLKKAQQELIKSNHIENQLNICEGFLSINKNEITIKIQDGPIKEVGINGIQITHVLDFCKEVYKSLNKDFPCRENALTITKIEEALHWQEARTKDRKKRKVEGFNKD